MPETVDAAGPAPRLALLTPYGVDADRADAVVASIEAACAVGDVAAVILRLSAPDERALTNLIKRIVPAIQAAEAAAVVAAPGFTGDLVAAAARGGADGVHLDRPDEGRLRELRERLRDGRILGVGGTLGSRHAAMAAGEAGVDYQMFGGLFPDGAAPDAGEVRERAQWWAEIFETPCIAVAATPGEVADLAVTGAEFVGLEGTLWLADPAGVRAAQDAIDRAAAARAAEAR